MARSKDQRNSLKTTIYTLQAEIVFFDRNSSDLHCMCAEKLQECCVESSKTDLMWMFVSLVGQFASDHPGNSMPSLNNICIKSLKCAINMLSLITTAPIKIKFNASSE